MKLSSGTRIGQSGRELAAAVFFSFFLHVILLLIAVFLYVNIAARTYIPPFYEVKLVGQPMEPTALAPTPPGVPQQTPPKQEPKRPAVKKASQKAPTAHARKGAMPELEGQKSKPTAVEQEKPAEAPRAQQPSAGTPTGIKSDSVAVTTSQQNFKDAWYLGLVRDKIGQNWRPPPDSKDAKARVIFSINRSGWVGEVNLDAEHSNGTFGFKAAAIRAIRASNPFPRLPDDFSRQTLEFSVDLMAE